ncbi:hypothetical protein M408DRAFT_233710 [Serendipita vermifera MAFF 305830]|uniref:Uncharacterized protein n=1 Tax=Serendipita vermifera MAFF 305830 TaxID=933852 RepID=A0A0C2X530_SERVB|nr:hypothetical protein M408DRAFT_233710 [Serendipita vermifera MAFF 305830]
MVIRSAHRARTLPNYCAELMYIMATDSTMSISSFLQTLRVPLEFGGRLPFSFFLIISFISSGLEPPSFISFFHFLSFFHTLFFRHSYFGDLRTYYKTYNTTIIAL